MARDDETDALRAHTDESLRAERERSDEELLARSTAIAEDAETVIERARARARLVLDLARDREDDLMTQGGASAALHAKVEAERRRADELLAGEHAGADAARLHDRELRRLALFQLLALERAGTDATLAFERTSGDRAVAARDEHLAGVAHDLRGMLGSILTHAAVIALRPDADRSIRSAEQIQRITGHMGRLLEDLLDYATISTQGMQVRRARVDAVALVRDAMHVHEAAAAANGIALELEADAASLEGELDAPRIMRLLVNLLGNALRHAPSGGRVVLRVARVGDECELAVEDDGPGIPEGELEAIFAPFHRADGAAGEGTGLGLHVARRIAEAHGGRIWAENAATGGAVFRTRLPLR